MGKRYLRWVYLVCLIVLFCWGCNRQTIIDYYFPELLTKTPSTATIDPYLVFWYMETRTIDYNRDYSLPPEKQSIICSEDENTFFYEVKAFEHASGYGFLDTGLVISPGDEIHIEAGGLACHDSVPRNCTGPEGNEQQRTELVGKIGGNKMFYIGSSMNLQNLTETGNLYLAFREEENYEDNTGSYEVCVNVANLITPFCESKTNERNVQSSSAEQQYTFSVNADFYTTGSVLIDTKLDVQQGQKLTFTAYGEACSNESIYSCNGPEGRDDPVRYDLLAKIGEGELFHVGTYFEQYVLTDGGRLYFAYNDTDWFDGNSGKFTVNVLVENASAEMCEAYSK